MDTVDSMNANDIISHAIDGASMKRTLVVDYIYAGNSNNTINTFNW